MAEIILTDKMRQDFESDAYLLIKQPLFEERDFFNLRNYLLAYILALPEELQGTYFTGNQSIRRPLHQDWVSAPLLVNLVEQILGPDIAYFNFAICYKPPKSKFRVGLHIDSHYWVETGCVDPNQVLTIFIPLTSINKEDGCLQVLPGINDCKIYPHKKLEPKYNYFHWEIADSAIDHKKIIDVEMEANQVCLLKSGLIHGSGSNNSSAHRLGLTIRYMSAKAKYNSIKDDPRKMILLKGRNIAGNEYHELNSNEFVGGFSWNS